MATADYVGQTLDNRYHVDQLVGRGGMGRVYIGRHARVGRKVAIKILNADLAKDDEIVKRFFREARSAAAIGHRNIIDVLDVGVTDGDDPYLVMEYLQGESLGGLLERSKSVHLAAACGIIAPVLQALTAAHRAGIVHRDLKPENIFLSYPEDGGPEVKLIDFGISKVTQEAKSTRLTDTGQLLGTPAYMAPEQAEDAGEADERTDIYSVGVIMYELLTGELPFDASSNYKLLAQVLKGEPKPPREANPDFPEEAEPVVLRAMAREPDERYQSAGEMISDIRKLSAFGERDTKLQMLASGVFKPTLPQGELGSHISTNGEEVVSAEAVLADIVERSTPSRRELKPKPGGLGSTKWAVAAVVGLLLLGGWYALGSGGTGDETAALGTTSVEPSKTDDESDEVEITVQGAPDGATILYDGAPVPDNPFHARKGRAIVPLEVRAEGYEDYAVSVTPNEDKTIQIEMALIPDESDDAEQAPPDGGESSQAKTRPARPARPAKTASKPSGERPGGFRETFE